MSKLSSGDALTERMRRSSSHKAGKGGKRGRGMSVTHDLRDSVLEALRATETAPMVVVPYAKFLDHGKLPRSSDKLQRAAEGSDVIVFITHRWWGDYIHETLQKRRNLTQRLRIVAKDQTGIKDLLIKDMIEDWWKKNEQERMNSKMTSAAESSMSSAD